MKKKQKFYVVWKGVDTGVFTDWNACKAQVQGYTGALYKSFDTLEEAKEAYYSSAWDYVGKKPKDKPTVTSAAQPPYIVQSLAVDAACSGNPGDMEYRGVYVETGQQVFHVGPFKQGTNNIGEFLAIVHALALFSQTNCKMPVYSDSRNAMLWVANKKCKTKLTPNALNAPVFELIERAEKWLRSNDFRTTILKWDTAKWGEIPADFGRKK